MRMTAAAAAAAGVCVGAHPSYVDRAGFGRRSVDLPPEHVAEQVVDQVARLQALARFEGAPVQSVKAHGALYHRLSRDEGCVLAVAQALWGYDAGLRFVMASGSPALGAAAASGLTVVREAFCDRTYLSSGALVPRAEAGAVIAHADQAARRVPYRSSARASWWRATARPSRSRPTPSACTATRRDR